MLLWIAIALLTAAAVMAVLAPLGRGAKSEEPADSAQRVYLDQLRELERDLAQDRIDVTEAAAARVEIARRLLGADAAPRQDLPAEGSQNLRRATALAALVGIPLFSLGTYFALGAPGLPGQPLAARLAAPAAPNDLAALVSRVEAHLAQAPEDGRGWEVIAPVYLRLARPEDAATAYRNAIRILGSSVSRQAGLGESLVAAAGGVVTAEAEAAFIAASNADPAAPGPRFYLALAAEQDGETSKAAEALRALLAEAPADAPWRASVSAALARVEGASTPGGPAPEQVASVQAMAPADQAAMIEGMVSGLAQRLESEPNDVEGWLRLIRSYMALGRPAEARAAGASALTGVPDPGSRMRVEALIAELGLSQERAP